MNFFSHNNLLLIFNYFWSTDSETVRLPYEVNEFYSFCWFCKLIGWDHCSYCVTYIGHVHVHSLLAVYMYHQMYTCGISGVKKAYILSFLKKEMNVALSQKTHTCKLYRYRSQSFLEPHHQWLPELYSHHVPYYSHCDSSQVTKSSKCSHPAIMLTNSPQEMCLKSSIRCLLFDPFLARKKVKNQCSLNFPVSFAFLSHLFFFYLTSPKGVCCSVLIILFVWVKVSSAGDQP